MTSLGAGTGYACCEGESQCYAILSHLRPRCKGLPILSDFTQCNGVISLYTFLTPRGRSLCTDVHSRPRDDEIAQAEFICFWIVTWATSLCSGKDTGGPLPIGSELTLCAVLRHSQPLADALAKRCEVSRHHRSKCSSWWFSTDHWLQFDIKWPALVLAGFKQASEAMKPKGIEISDPFLTDYMSRVISSYRKCLLAATEDA